MEYFRFVPPALLTAVAMVSAMPSPQDTPASTTRLAPAQPVPQTRFLGGLLPGGLPQTNPNQNVQNTLAAGGLGLVGGVAATNCIFNNDCNLSFRPQLGGSIDANGNFKPQLGLTTQVGDGSSGIGTTFTGGLQLDQNSQNGIGTFVAGGINNGDPNSLSPGIQTGFGFSQGANGQTQAVSQLGGGIQAPQVAGVNFHQPNRPLGITPTLFGGAIGQPSNQPGQPVNNNPFHQLFFGGR